MKNEAAGLLAHIQDQAGTFLSQNLTPYLYNIVVALLIFFVGRWVVRRLAKFSEPAMEKRMDPMAARFLANILFIALFAFVVIAAIAQLGVHTSSLVAIFGAAGLAVALSLRNSLANFAAGVLLVTLHPFKIGDYVQVADTSGTVKAVTIFSTILALDDNCTATLPNGIILQAKIVNYSDSERRGISITVRVPYSADLGSVRAELTKLIDTEPRILRQPAPTVSVTNLADNGVDVNLFANTKTSDYWSTRFALNERIKNRFTEMGIDWPPQRMAVAVSQPARV